MTCYTARNLSSSRLRSMGFSTMSDQPDSVKFRRGCIIGTLKPGGQHSRDVVDLQNLSDNEGNMDRALSDLQKVAPTMKVV